MSEDQNFVERIATVLCFGKLLSIGLAPDRVGSNMSTCSVRCRESSQNVTLKRHCKWTLFCWSFVQFDIGSVCLFVVYNLVLIYFRFVVKSAATTAVAELPSNADAWTKQTSLIIVLVSLLAGALFLSLCVCLVCLVTHRYRSNKKSFTLPGSLSFKYFWFGVCKVTVASCGNFLSRGKTVRSILPLQIMDALSFLRSFLQVAVFCSPGRRVGHYNSWHYGHKI